jgi:tripartite-type tricarboxylate transporter receptor subunit TctC
MGSFASYRSAAAAALAVLAALSAPAAWAQGDPAAGWPKQPVKIVVGFPPGGGNDILARVYGQAISEAIKQPVVIENKPGAAGFIAAEQVARAAPDGYTLLLGPSGTLTFAPAVYSKLPYHPQNSFEPIAILGRFPLVVAVNADLGVKSVAELVAWAKANPTKANYGSTSPAFQLPTELFKSKVGIEAVHIPFKGSAEKMTAVANGQIAFAFVDPGPTTAHVKSGRARVIATTGAKRTAEFPEVPTLAESGIAGIDVQIFGGLLAPKGTPAAIVKRLEAEVDAAARSPQVVERLRGLGIPVSDVRSAGFARLIAEEIPLWTSVAQAAKIKLD